MTPSRGVVTGIIQQQKKGKPLIKQAVYSELTEMLGMTCTLDAFSPSLTSPQCKQDCHAVPLPQINYVGDEFFTRETTNQVVLLYPEEDRVAEALSHYTVQKATDVTLSALVVVPSTRGKKTPWTKYLKGMQLLKQYYGRDRVFGDIEGKTINTHRSVEVYYDPPLSLPAQDRAERILAPLSKEEELEGEGEGEVVAVKPRNRMVFDTNIKNLRTVVLMDSGATHSVMEERLCKQLSLPVQPISEEMEVAGKSTIQTKGIVRAPLRIGKFIRTIPFLVVTKVITGVEVILGEDFLTKERVDLQYSKNQAYIASEGITVYPIQRGDLHTRSPTLLTLIEAAKGRKVNSEVMSAKQAVRALRQGHDYYLINVREPKDSSKQLDSTRILISSALGTHIQSLRLSTKRSKIHHSLQGESRFSQIPRPEDVLPKQKGCYSDDDKYLHISSNSTQIQKKKQKKSQMHLQQKQKKLQKLQNRSHAHQTKWPLQVSVVHAQKKGEEPEPPEPTFEEQLEDRIRQATEHSGLINIKLLRNLILKYKDVFQSVPAGLPPDRRIPHVIKLEAGTVPFYRTNKRMSPAEIEVCKQFVEDMLKKGHITPSTSPFGAPMMMVAKPNGGFRAVCDWRALNKKTIKMRFPLPRIDETLDKLSGASVFSSCDLASGYFQIRISDEDAHKTAFTTPFGQYEFKVLGQGLTNAPSTFQSLMHRLFQPYIGKFVVIYLDDILIYSKTPEEHLIHLEKVLQILKEEKLYANLAKCDFNKSEVAFLGHIVGREGVKVNPKKIAVVKDWPIPTDATQLRQFLGLTNYFRRFIQGYSSITSPLNNLIRKTVDFKKNWTEEHTSLIEQLKEALTTAPVLALPNFDEPFELVSDASIHGTGAVLLQNGRPIAFTSSKFKAAEVNYTTTEQELLGVVKALKEWRCYAEGAKGLKVVTDHNPLVYLHTQPTLSRRMARWEQELTDFSFSWEYRAGRNNVADPISRNPRLVVMQIATMFHSIAATRAQKKKNKPALSPLEGIMDRIKKGYAEDPQFQGKMPRFWEKDGDYYFYQGKVIVPEVDTLKEDILTAMHAPASEGHMGREKTIQKVRRTFYWLNMAQAVKLFIKSCHQCQVNKPSNQKPGGLLQPVEIPSNFWECVTTDLITKLPPTQKGYDAIAVFVCKLSKMVIAEPCQSDINAEEFAQLFLRSVYRHHGLPKKLISDRDARFTGKFLRVVADALDIRQAFSTSFHPQTDGQTERTNRTLEEVLRHYTSPYQDDWDEHLYLAEFAINSAHNFTTGQSPFFAIYGRHPETAITLEVKAKLQNTVPRGEAVVTQLCDRISHAKLCLEKAQARMKAYADQSRREVAYAVGQEVLLSTKNLKFKAAGSPKFAPRFVGPFKIISLVGKYSQENPKELEVVTAVKLELPPLMRIHPVFHVSLIKPYHPGTGPVPVQPLAFDHDGAPLWEVEAILSERSHTPSKRKGRGQPKVRHEYLVKWKNFGPEHDSWEPESNVKHLQSFTDFKARIKPVPLRGHKP